MDNHFSSGYMYGPDGAQPHARHHQQQQPQHHHQQPPPPPPPHLPQPHGMNAFSSMPAPPPQQQHDSPAAHTTLPPLQPTANAQYPLGGLSYSSAGHPQPGPSLQTPTSSSLPPGTAFASHSPASSSQPGVMMPPYGHQPYSMSQSLMYPASTATSLAGSNAPAGLPTIQPRPPPVTFGGPLHPLPHLAGAPAQMGLQSSFMQNEEAPTHVVGSQGRRGVLPSAPGRPNPPSQGGSQSAKSMIPQKDADGKFPCPHCHKTYLHAKHLKRHLLRHTGDRPYMCHLCKDTFSRSDILKRHFQKCSIRRGNPTGANHLAHQTQRRNNGNTNRLSISQQDGPIGLAGLPEITGTPYNGSSPAVNGDISTRSSRANTLTTPGTMSHRNSVAGLGVLPPNPTPGAEHGGSSATGQPGMPAYVIPNPGSNAGAMHPNYAFANPQMNGNVFNNANPPSQMSFLGQQSSRFETSRNHSPHQQNPNGDGSGHQIDWNRMFNHGGQDGFVDSHPANVSSQVLNPLKPDNDTKQAFGMPNTMSNESFLGSLYSHQGTWGEYGDSDQGLLGFTSWSSGDPLQATLQAKVDRLVHFCFPNGVVDSSPAAAIVHKSLTPEMVKHFAEQYTSYHGHWPFIHIPTFKINQASDVLVMAIICIGAIYSPQLTAAQSRQMMAFLRDVALANSYVYNQFLNGNTEGLGSMAWHVEELEALVMIHSMFTWHGEPQHRQAARDDFPTLCNLAKAMDLCQHAPPGHYAFSPMHSTSANSMSPVDVNTWDWHSWLEQEKRNRGMYFLFLTDAAMALCFNCEPQFDPFQVRLMLPSDDAAWEAKDAHECAAALGLLGPEAQGKNLSGARRLRQPGMREALRTLMEPTAMFQPGASNAYGKFILVHALITRIISCQKAPFQPNSHFQTYNVAFNSSTPATPLSQNDWLEQRSSSTSFSANSSGRATPTESSEAQNMAIQQERKRLSYALDKWKRTWDQDMDRQYPPGQQNLRRFGFSRDGVHFFYLGCSFMQSRSASDWTAGPDVRFSQVMALLKRLKGFVIGDNELKGQDIGSVSDIHEQYGLDELTLDMTMLFCPFNSSTDQPVAALETILL